MVEEFKKTQETAWCPGCGNFGLRNCLVQVLKELDVNPSEVVMFSGIGQAAKTPHYINVNGFNGLHGRSLPPAIGQRVANHQLKVIVESGDGCSYGEGGNHLLHNIRRNPDLVHLVHNNQIYGLTKGQASPTSEEEMKTVIQPEGVTAEPFNPVRFALGLNVSFVARGFVGESDHLKAIMKEAFLHRGYALIDILQPCVSFNKINTWQWYQERVYQLDEDYDAHDYSAAVKKAQEWGEKIPLGIIYRQEKPVFKDNFSPLKEKPLMEQETISEEKFAELLTEFK